MRVDEFDYDLPPNRIAQRAIEPRHDARLLVDRGDRSSPDHQQVRDLPHLLRPGDAVVLNDSRVMPARLDLRKESGGAVEVLLLEQEVEGSVAWQALVRPGRKVPEGTVLLTPSGDPAAVAGGYLADGVRHLDLLIDPSSIGTLPYPPYIEVGPEDPERYQTVFSRQACSAAAPTAGLHFTPSLLERCRAAGARVVMVELAVGLGTFRPVKAEWVEHHEMHSERYAVSSDAWASIATADRVVAVGTTVVRTLETVARTGELSGRSSLFLRRGDEFLIVDRLITNFHQPRSTLLMMIDAFIGPRWRRLYDLALADSYRFLSFGDALWLTPDRDPQ